MTPRQLGAVVLASIAAPAAAQDSVSLLNIPPGDSINAYDTADQVNDYIVDMAPLSSTWGNTYGIAPLVKSSTTQGPFFNNLISGTAVSRDLMEDVPFIRNSYDYWSGQGFGVSNAAGANNPGTPVDTTGMTGTQFSLAFGEFGGGNENYIVGGIVNFDPTTPSRFYVSRVVGAVNGPDFTCNLSQFGFGGVSSAGVVGFRSDDFGTAASCGLDTISGNNLFTVDLAQRGAALNVIDSLGGSDAAATSWLVNNASTTQITPTMYANASGESRLIGATFGNEFVYENATGTGVNTSFGHLPLGVISSRGNPSYSEQNFGFLGGVNGTSGLIGRDTNAADIYTYVWGLGADGSPSGNMRLDLPAVVTDNSTGWSTDTLGTGQPEFSNIGSQTSFRGGNGQVAIGKDQAGRMIVAAVIDHPDDNMGANNNGNQAIAVARVSADGSTTEWTLAAHCDPTSGAAGTGKPLLDGPGGNVVGRLISFETLTIGSQTGPSMTSPMIDSVGNIYFVAAVEVDLGGGLTNPGSGLVRAVYNPSTFSYELELIFDSGTELRGLNSDTDYIISFIQIADSNSIGSEAVFSSNMRGGAFNGLDPQSLDPTDPRTMGGIAMSVEVFYDVDDDGDYEVTPGSLDQDYRIMIFVAPTTDCNANGIPDDIDIAEGSSTDVNQNGVPDECDTLVGDSYCISVPNSTGGSAVMSATGSTSVAANDLILVSTPVAPNQPGIFYYGPNQILNAFGNGFRCVGAGATGVARLPVENGGPAGVLIHVLDNTMSPTPATMITPGSTWNFQAWFRDPVAGGSFFNLSDGLQVTFTP